MAGFFNIAIDFILSCNIQITVIIQDPSFRNNCDTHCRISCSLSRTSTDRNVVTSETLGISTANARCIAWIGTPVVEAGG